MSFSQSYLGKLRQVIGPRPVLMPGARIVVHDRQQRVLLELRKDFRKWGVPGGSGELGDDIATTARRELYEETGLKVAKLEPFGIASNPKNETITFPNGDVIQNLAVLFHAPKPKGVVRPDAEEALDLAWFAPGKLPRDILPNSLRTLRAYWRFRKTGKFQMI
jgi:8-oxo-dGTP pyrophosphatase MutT (NUDIX family)